MAKRNHPVKKFKLAYRPGMTLVKTALLAVIVLSTAALIALGGCIRDAQTSTAALTAQAAALEQQNSALERNIEDLGSTDSIERIAKEELGLVDPDTVVFITGKS